MSKKTLSLILLNKKKFIQIELLVAELINFENWYKKRMENSKREYQRYYIFVSWKNGKPAKLIHEELKVAEGSNAVSLSTIYRWIEVFENGEENIEDDQHPRCPREAVTPQNIAKIEDLIGDDPNISIRVIQDKIGISKDSIGNILHNELNVHKICKKWVPHVLTDENKKTRVETSRQLLEILDSGLNNIITGDESWFHFYTVPSKEANKTWVKVGENRPQIARTAQNSKKRMVCIFFTMEGVIARIVVPKGQSVNASFYKNKVLSVVFSNYKELKNRRTMKNMMLHHDNAASHKAQIITEYLQEEKIFLLPHPPYSPDLAPCDFFLFPRIKKELKNRHFDNVENLARAIQAITDSIPKEDYQKSFENWKIRLQQCIDHYGNYFEGMH